MFVISLQPHGFVDIRCCDCFELMVEVTSIQLTNKFGAEDPPMLEVKARTNIIKLPVDSTSSFDINLPIEQPVNFFLTGILH